MHKITKMRLTLLGIAAVLGFTYYNYTIGKTSLSFLLLASAVLGFSFFNILNFLLQEHKKK